MADNTINILDPGCLALGTVAAACPTVIGSGLTILRCGGQISVIVARIPDLVDAAAARPELELCARIGQFLGVKDLWACSYRVSVGLATVGEIQAFAVVSP